MTKKTIVGRMTPELRDLLKERASIFNTSLPKEQTNLVNIMKEIENKIGIDFRNTLVTKHGVTLQTKKRITIIK